VTGANVLLEDVAAAILDGTPIDWDSIESKVHELDRSILAGLKLLATLKNVHQPASAPTRRGSKSPILLNV